MQSTPVGVALTTDQLALLEARIASLPDKHRTALLLHYRDGMTYKAIAEELSLVSLASAYGVVQTALARIRRLYEGKKPRNSLSAAHELAVERNDRGVRVGEEGKGWFQGFAAPRASEFFATSVPAGRGGAEAPAGVDNMDGDTIIFF